MVSWYMAYVLARWTQTNLRKPKTLFCKTTSHSSQQQNQIHRVANPEGASQSEVINHYRVYQTRGRNKIIDEGLVWQGEMCQSERYERQCCLKQCFQCQNNGHIRTQCKAAKTCGCCVQEHSSRDCPSKAERDTPRKCANCHGPYEAWNQQSYMGKTLALS